VRFAFLIFKYFPFGGVQRDMLRIANDLAQLGHEVDIYTGHWRGALPSHRKIQVFPLPFSGWFNHQRHQSLINAMQAELTEYHYDMVVGFNRMPGLDAYYAADPCYLQRVQQEGNFLVRLTGRYLFFKACEEAVFGKQGAKLIFLLSARDRAIFQHYYATSSQRFHVLTPHLPVNMYKGLSKASVYQQVRRTLGLPKDARIVLTVGSSYWRKGVDRVVEAMAALPVALLEKTWLLAVGEYESGNRFMQQIEMLGIGHRCMALGGRKDVAELMLASDVFAHPARSELAGIVIIEAMLAQTPVLVTDVCGYAPHVQACGAGVVIKQPYEQAQINHAFAQLLQGYKYPKMAVKTYLKQLQQKAGKAQEAQQLIAYAQSKQARSKA
jgi:UDP-glucose:(heptosyl)LPS alpha-1,3-glucosyltransferase